MKPKIVANHIVVNLTNKTREEDIEKSNPFEVNSPKKLLSAIPIPPGKREIAP